MGADWLGLLPPGRVLEEAGCDHDPEEATGGPHVTDRQAVGVSDGWIIVCLGENELKTPHAKGGTSSGRTQLSMKASEALPRASNASK
jgi:hypothetical protein